MALNPVNVEEQQIVAVKDDGSAEGLLRAKISEGELIKVSFLNGGNGNINNVGTTGSGTFGFGTNAYPNSNGSGTGCATFSGASGGGLGSSIGVGNFEFFGTQLGLSFLILPTDPVSTVPNSINRFSVVIDGMPYDWNAYKTGGYINNKLQGTTFVNEILWQVAENLPNTRHSLQIINFPDPNYKKQFFFLSMLLERRAGYNEKPRLDRFYGAGTLTASATNVPDTYSFGTDGNNYNVFGVKSILYYNTDSSTRIVTIKYNGNNIFTISLAAGTSQKFDLSQSGTIVVNGIAGGTTDTLQHLADAASVVKFTCIGGL